MTVRTIDHPKIISIRRRKENQLIKTSGLAELEYRRGYSMTICIIHVTARQMTYLSGAWFLSNALCKKKKPLRPTDQNPFQVRSNINSKNVVLSGQQKGWSQPLVNLTWNSRFFSTPNLTTTVGSFQWKSHNSHNVCYRAASTKECNNSIVWSVAATFCALHHSLKVNRDLKFFFV